MRTLRKLLLGLLVISLIALFSTVYGAPLLASSAIAEASALPATTYDFSAIDYDNPNDEHIPAAEAVDITLPPRSVSASESINGEDSAPTSPAPTATPTLIVAAQNSPDKSSADYICDGIDDQVEINAAINALPAGGGKVLLLGGTFNVSSTILIHSDMTLEGTGHDTLLYLVDNSNCDVISNKGGYARWMKNVTIRNLRIDGNKDNQSAGCGIRRHGKYAVYENLWIENCYRRGIFHIHGDYTQIINNMVRDCDGIGISLSETCEGIIANNTVYNCGLGKLGRENRAIGIYHGANNKINYNYISSGGSNRQICGWDSPHLEIMGNTLVNGLFMGIAPHSQYTRIIGNTLTNCGENAIDLCGENDCWVERNTIIVVSGGKENTGICVNSERSTIINNNIEFCGRAGIQFGAHVNNHILDNTIRNCGQSGRGQAGIWVQMWQSGTINSGTVIRGNICFDDQDIPTQLYGVNLDAHNGYIDNIIVEDNDLRNNGVAGIKPYYSKVRNPIIRNNLGTK